MSGTLLDDVMPSYAFSERHTVWTPAGVDEAYAAVKAVTAPEIRLFAPLMAIRMLPNRLRGTARRVTIGPLLEQFVAQGFAVLGERPGCEVVLGGVGRFWNPGDDGPVRGVRSREDFIAFAEAGFAKAAFNLTVTAEASGTRITTETRIVGTDGSSTRRFALYWLLIRLPSGAIRRSWLNAIRRRLEHTAPKEPGISDRLRESRSRQPPPGRTSPDS